MWNNKPFLFLLIITLVTVTSCATKKSYGSRHSRYSSDRIAMMDKKSQGNRSYTSQSNSRAKERDAYTTSPNTTTTTKSPDIRKVRYHAERNAIVREASKYQGVPYVYGGKNPSEGFDCSGFVSYVLNAQQIHIAGTAQALSRMGHRKAIQELHIGDLVFFGTVNDISHVGIITLNDGENISMIHASSSQGIKSDNITHSDYWRERLLFGVDIITPHLEEDLGMK